MDVRWRDQLCNSTNVGGSLPHQSNEMGYSLFLNYIQTVAAGENQLMTNHSAPFILTHWGRVMHICVSKLTIIGSDNGLSPGRRQAIIWTNAEILLIGPLGTNFSEILTEIHTFSFKKIYLKMLYGKWQPFCLGLNVLKTKTNSHKRYILSCQSGKFSRTLVKSYQKHSETCYILNRYIIRRCASAITFFSEQ